MNLEGSAWLQILNGRPGVGNLTGQELFDSEHRAAMVALMAHRYLNGNIVEAEIRIAGIESLAEDGPIDNWPEQKVSALYNEYAAYLQIDPIGRTFANLLARLANQI